MWSKPARSKTRWISLASRISARTGVPERPRTWAFASPERTFVPCATSMLSAAGVLLPAERAWMEQRVMHEMMSDGMMWGMGLWGLLLLVLVLLAVAALIKYVFFR